MRLVLTVLFLLSTMHLAAAETLAGRASVIDADTIELQGQKIRLLGIDAPESRQACTDQAGQPWRCGQKAALALADKIGQATVRCEGKSKDRYKRLIAVCWLGSEDLNAWLVGEGWALAYRRYSKAYIPAEEAARNARKGLWAGTFDAPWDWRKHH